MIGTFTPATRDFGCAVVHELMSGSQRVGIVWKSKVEDEAYGWAAGDGSQFFGMASTLADAKGALLRVGL